MCICILGPFPPPSNIHISKADFVSKAITFKWSTSPATSDCPSNNYTILSSNCGSCPTTTTNTTVTCTDVPSDGGNCAFAVHTAVCDIPWPGGQSDSITLTLTKEGQCDCSIITPVVYLICMHSCRKRPCT